MKPELNAYLDGEIAKEDLRPELLAEADRWDRLYAELPEADTAMAAPSWIESAVMEEVLIGSPLTEQAVADPVKKGWLDWLLKPRSVQVSPALGFAAMAGLVVVMSLLNQPGSEVVGLPEEEMILVQFVFEAPTAQSVAVSGDFNEWSEDGFLSDSDGDGVWTGRFRVLPGTHEYMFVINGTEWQTDPQAESYRDDGFGSQNAVLTVQAAI